MQVQSSAACSCHKSGETPSDIAAQQGHAHIAKWLKRCCCVRGPIQHWLLHRARRLSADLSGCAPSAKSAHPEDPSITKMLTEALRPWHRMRHGLFPREFLDGRLMRNIWLNSVVPFCCHDYRAPPSHNY